MSELVDVKMESERKDNPQTPQNRKLSVKNSFGKNIPFYLILLPAVITVFMVQYLPMFGLLIAFKDYNVRAGIFGSPWAEMGGFANFVQIFQTPAFLDSVWNTLWLNVLSLLFSFPAPIILALLINEVGHTGFKRTVQTISYLPHFLSIAAVTTMVNQLLGNYGLVNAVLKFFGAESVYLLEQESAFVPTYVITEVWQTVGWGTIVYLAAITGINPDLYEAADIDGASAWRKIWAVTIPGMMPVIGIQLILNAGNLIKDDFDQIYSLVGGSNYELRSVTEVFSSLVFRNLQGGPKGFSASTAISLVQSVMSLGLVLTADAIVRKTDNPGLW